MLLSCAPTNKGDLSSSLRRTTSTPNLCASHVFQSHVDGLAYSDVPIHQDTRHVRRAGLLRTTDEAQSWIMVANHADLAASSQPHPEISYVSINRLLTKLEFGFPKVDQTSRETLSKGIAAINELLAQQAQSSPVHAQGVQLTPQLAFHESHYPADFKQGTSVSDYTHYHPMGLTYINGQRATHYHYSLIWTSTQTDARRPALPPAPSPALHKRTADEVLQLLLTFLAEPAQNIVSNPARLARDLRLAGPAPTEAARQALRRIADAMPPSPTPTHWYDTLATRGARADQRHPLSKNLERTQEEIQAWADQLASGAPDAVKRPETAGTGADMPKRVPDIGEFAQALLVERSRRHPSRAAKAGLENEKNLIRAIQLSNTARDAQPVSPD